MIYTLENYILFSLIYSSVKEGRFPSQEYDNDILVEVFKTSITDEENIFEASENKKLEIINKSAKILQNRNSRINIEKRIENMINLFIESDKINNLAKKIPLEMELLEKNNIKTIVYEDKKYPKHLKELKDSPFIIYYKGYFPNDNELEKSLAIIGTRNPEEKYGREVARRVGKTLLDEGWWNISGLAIGCDEYGHKGSIGATGAILAQGLATPIFPKENTELANEILANKGFLMSELPPSTKPNFVFFVLRDRLKSGLTKGIFVVETPRKNGTLHTVKYSLEQNRKTFVWNPLLIKDLQNEKEVQGNIGLLDRSAKKYEFNVSIPKSLKENTISIKNSQSLLTYLENIEKEINIDNKIFTLGKDFESTNNPIFPKDAFYQKGVLRYSIVNDIKYFYFSKYYSEKFYDKRLDRSFFFNLVEGKNTEFYANIISESLIKLFGKYKLKDGSSLLENMTLVFFNRKNVLQIKEGYQLFELISKKTGILNGIDVVNKIPGIKVPEVKLDKIKSPHRIVIFDLISVSENETKDFLSLFNITNILPTNISLEDSFIVCLNLTLSKHYENLDYKTHEEIIGENFNIF